MSLHSFPFHPVQAPCGEFSRVMVILYFPVIIRCVGKIKYIPSIPGILSGNFIVKKGATHQTLFMQNEPNSQTVKYFVTNLNINTCSILDRWHFRKKRTQNEPKRTHCKSGTTEVAR